MKVVTLGSAMYDLFIDYPFVERITQQEQSYVALPEGKKMEVERVTASLGGGASNSAVSFIRFGFDVSLCAKIGNDAASDFIIDGLVREGVHTEGVITSDVGTGTSYIVLSPSGDHAILVYRGANLLLSHEDVSHDIIAQADLLYITSLTGSTSALLPRITQEAANNNIRVAVNPGTSQLTRDIDTLIQSLSHIEILILNSYEAHLLKVGLKSAQQLQLKTCKACAHEPELLKSACEHALLQLIDFVTAVHALGTRVVVVTNGAQGVYVSDSNNLYYHPSIPTDVISSVGAGDAFGSAFVALQAIGKSIPESLYAGLCNSSSVLQYMNAQDGLLTLDEMKKRLKNFDEIILKIYSLI